MEQSVFEKLIKVLDNETIIEGLRGKSAEEAISFLSDLGVTITKEELQEFHKMLKEENDELSEEQLMFVAGGSWSSWWKRFKSVVRGIFDEILGK